MSPPEVSLAPGDLVRVGDDDWPAYLYRLEHESFENWATSVSPAVVSLVVAVVPEGETTRFALLYVNDVGFKRAYVSDCVKVSP